MFHIAVKLLEVFVNGVFSQFVANTASVLTAQIFCIFISVKIVIHLITTPFSTTASFTRLIKQFR